MWRYEIPSELQQLLLDFTVCCLVERPCSLVDFAADYFAQLRQRRQQQQAASVVASAHGNGHGPESDDSMLTDDSDEPSPGKPLALHIFFTFSFSSSSSSSSSSSALVENSQEWRQGSLAIQDKYQDCFWVDQDARRLLLRGSLANSSWRF